MCGANLVEAVFPRKLASTVIRILRQSLSRPVTSVTPSHTYAIIENLPFLSSKLHRPAPSRVEEEINRYLPSTWNHEIIRLYLIIQRCCTFWARHPV